MALGARTEGKRIYMLVVMQGSSAYASPFMYTVCSFSCQPGLCFLIVSG